MKPDIHSEEFLRRMMRRQLKLSISIAAVFGALLFGMPLANYFAGNWMSIRVGGFTLNWLILGVLFFPLVWVLSWFFIRSSMAMEREEAEWAKQRKPEARHAEEKV